MAKSQNTARPFPFNMEFAGLNPEATNAAAQAWEAWFRCAMAINTEAGKFITMRLQRDAQLPMSIIGCHSPQDVMRTQNEFLKTMAEDYANQTNKIGEILSESFHSVDRPQSLASVRPSSPSRYRERAAA